MKLPFSDSIRTMKLTVHVSNSHGSGDGAALGHNTAFGGLNGIKFPRTKLLDPRPLGLLIRFIQQGSNGTVTSRRRPIFHEVDPRLLTVQSTQVRSEGLEGPELGATSF